MWRVTCFSWFIGAISFLSTPTYAESALILDGPKELTPVPSTLSYEPRTYIKGDPIVRFQIKDAQRMLIQLPGFSIDGLEFSFPNGLEVRPSLFFKATFNWKRPIGPSAWRTEAVFPGAEVFCTPSDREVVPRTASGQAYRVCLIDRQATGIFDAVLVAKPPLTGQSYSYFGPISIPPIVRDKFVNEEDLNETLDFYLDSVGNKGINIGFKYMRSGDKSFPYGIYLNTNIGLANIFNVIGSSYCFVRTKDRKDQALVIGDYKLIVESSDATANSARISFSGNAAHSPVYVVRRGQSWKPSLAAGCGNYD